MKIGIVGLPNVGKSTLFNSITKAGAECANYPFCTIEPNIGVVAVPDERLEKLAEIYKPQKVTNAIIEFVDSIVQVVRCFENSNIVHVDGNINPIRDIETINLELIFADLETIEKRLERVAKMLKADKKYQFEIDTLQKVKNVLEEGKCARVLDYTDEERDVLKEAFLLTLKPTLYVANISEEEIGKEQENENLKKVIEYAKTENAEVIPLCVKIEEELSSIDSKAEKQEMLEVLGLEESGLDKLIKASYKLLGLMSFLTAGEPEVRAWTIKIGTKAPQAAGKIHSDIERGFIRAEIISYDDLMTSNGSMVQAKEKGLIRLEGKDYIMQDGDIALFRFNV